MLRVHLSLSAIVIAFAAFATPAAAETSCPGGGVLVCKPQCTLGPPPVCTNSSDCRCELRNTGGVKGVLGTLGTANQPLISRAKRFR